MNPEIVERLNEAFRNPIKPHIVEAVRNFVSAFTALVEQHKKDRKKIPGSLRTKRLRKKRLKYLSANIAAHLPKEVKPDVNCNVTMANPERLL